MSQPVIIPDRIEERKLEIQDGSLVYPKRKFVLWQFLTEFRWIYFKNQLSLLALSQENFLRFEYEHNLKIPSGWFILYRAFYFLAISGIFAISMYDDVDEDNWRLYFIYLTHWALIIQVVYGTVFFLRVLIGFKGRRKKERLGLQLVTSSIHVEEFPPHYQENSNEKKRGMTPMKCLDGFIWLLFIFSQTFSHGVTLGFWASVWSTIYRLEISTYQMMKFFQVHGVQSVLAIVDLFVVAIPLRSCQVVYVILLSEFYLLFTMIYHYGGGQYHDPNHNYIYAILEWDNPEVTSCFVIINFIPCFLLFFLAWLGAWGRMKLATRKKKQDVLYENVFWYRERLEGTANKLNYCPKFNSIRESEGVTEKRHQHDKAITVLVKKKSDKDQGIVNEAFVVETDWSVSANSVMSIEASK